MATIRRPADSRTETRTPLVSPISDEELMHRNRAAISLLEAWETEGDEEEQRETMKVLREALGVNRIASCRNLFP